MSTGNSALGGGVEKERGAFFEDVTLLHYALWRIQYDPSLEVTLETEEDATFRYSSGVTELIQCKKRETREGAEAPGATYEDYWVRGRYAISDLSEWVVRVRNGHSAVSALHDDPRLYFTALVYGDLSDDLQDLVPASLGSRLPLDYVRPQWNKLFLPESRGSAGSTSPVAQILTTPDVLSRVRILPMASPGVLERACEWLLESPVFDVGYPRTRRLVAVLLELIKRRSLSRTGRTVSAAEIVRIIRDSRSSKGSWQDARSLLREQVDQSACVPLGELPLWSDLEGGRFVRRREFTEAANELKKPASFVVISGAVGAGKSTFSRYLAFAFLKDSPHSSVFFLFPTLGVMLNEERDFLEQNLDRDVLFVIEDQHLAAEEVEPLIETFLAGQLASKRCRLVLTSKVNYGHTEGLAKGLATKDLRNACLYALPNRSKEEVERLLVELRPLGLTSALSDRQLAEISGGVIGIALLIARSIPASRATQLWENWVHGRRLREHLATWIWKTMGTRDTFNETGFREQVVPPFVLGAFGLPVSRAEFETVGRLERAGYFEEMEDPTYGLVSRPCDLNLAFLIQDQHRDLHHNIVSNWVRRHPEGLDLALQKAASYRDDTFAALCHEFTASIISELCRGVQSARWATRILRLVRTADRALSNEVFRSWTAPGNAPNRFFWIGVFRRAATVSELAGLIEVIAEYDSSAHSLSDLDPQLGEDALEEIGLLFADPRSEVDQIGRCLQALRRCSFEFGSRVYERWANTETCRKHLQNISDARLPRLLRYLERVVPFDRLRVYQTAEIVFPAGRLSALLANSSGMVTPQIALLSRLGRLHPLLAARGLAQAVRDGGERIVSGLRIDDTLDRITQDLYLLAAVNRRLAIFLANGVLDRIVDLTTAETNYALVGGRTESMRRNLSVLIAERMALAIDREAVLASLRTERRHIDKVGKFLYDLSICDHNLAAEFESQLDLLEMLQITRAPRLRDLALAIRGFLAAASREVQAGEMSQRKKLLKLLLSSTSFLALLAERRKEVRNLSEIGFALSCLMDCNLAKPDILRMLGFNNYREFAEELAARASQERSVIHMAAGLYGIARFDSGLGHTTSKVFVISANELPVTYNLVDLGCLLQALSAVDPQWARSILGRYSVGRLTAIVAKEKNLGRVAVILTGLSQCSHRIARSVASGLTRDANWRQLYRSNEDFNALIHFVHVLRKTMPQASVSFVDYVLTNHAAEVLEFLRVQANLMPVAHWLRTAAGLDPSKNKMFLGSLANVIKETLEYDTDLWHLLESAEGLLNVQQYPVAREVIDRISSQGTRIRGIRQLSSWVVVVSKLLHVARRSPQPAVAGRLLSEMEPWRLELLVLTDASPVVAALTLRLLASEVELVPKWFTDLANSLRPRLIASIVSEEDSIAKVLALLLCRAHPKNTLDALHGITTTRAWEVGLLSFLVQPNSGSSLSGLLSLQAKNVFEASGTELARSISDLPTIELALTRVALDLNPGNDGFRNELLREIDQRSDGETLAGIRWLLTRLKSGKLEPPTPRVLLSILHETVLRPTYLPWRSDLEQVVDAAAFDQTPRRNELGLLSSLQV